jgi:AcrR family transcriptional regulator
MPSKGKKTTRTVVKERILCEATRLFGERGFGGVALRDIAKACDIPLSTLSSHFPRKRDLQEVVFKRAVEIVIKRDLTSRLCTGSPKQRFRRYLVNVVELFLSNLPEMKVMDREFQELDKRSTFDLLTRTSRDRVSLESQNFIAALVENTKSDILESIPSVQLMRMVFAGIYGMVKLRPIYLQVAPGRIASNEALTRDIVLMFERMLGI